MPEITMPRLSDTMEDGVVSAWLKQVGDQVARGDVLAEIETDKALMELEAYDDGVLEQILVEPGTRVAIGAPIALVGDGSGAGKSAAPVAGSASAAAGSLDPDDAAGGTSVADVPGAVASTGDATSSAGAQSVSPGNGVRPKSSPLARKIAGELGIDIATVRGTGPGGRITRQDVEAAHRATATPSTRQDTDAGQPTAIPAATPQGASVNGTADAATGSAAPAGDYTEEPLSNIQRVAAKRLTESKQQAPHFYLTSAIDVTDLLAFRAEVNGTLQSAGKGKVSVNDLIVKAVAATLRTDPGVNVSFAGDKLLRHNGIHLGVAVAIPTGLVVPVIRDADRKGVSEIAAETVEKAERARAGRLRADEMSGGTFTISNLGMFGIEQFAAVINPPEAAILAVGAATDELRLADGEIVVRKILRVTLSADHRAIDGATGARFLQQLKSIIEQPLRIVT
ncbi:MULTISPECIES: dihydrolipoamide acetyltransferase family protein [unclassified Nocardia]|uniref:dihydrolipoamide acetyltransferase family protein n=1 Tax=unclassified Nocardia TaxID=2637762 RepID=UPI001CE3E6FA|nr:MULTISPECIES: dihydrolipoamide acetyltransferase family protein [unclassified Nocardia]